MKLALLLLAACGGSREWAGRARELLEREDDTGDTAADTDTPDTDDTDDTAGDSAADTDTGLPPLEGDPCAPTIPMDARIVTDDLADAEDHVSAWVCRAGMYSTSGSAVSTFLEARADGLLSGTGGRAWVRASGRLVVYAGPNEVWIEEGAELTIEAEGVVVSTCPSITFTGGPAGGC